MVVKSGVHVYWAKSLCLNFFKTKFFSVVNKMESLQLKFFKRILGVHSKSANLAVYGELGRVPLIVQISTLVTKYWIRIQAPNDMNTLVGEAGSFNDIRSNTHAGSRLTLQTIY
jgi:hypothetical protein